MGCTCATVNYFRKVSNFARQCCFHATGRPFMQPPNFRARQDMPINKHIHMLINCNYEPRKASSFTDSKMLIESNHLLRKFTGIFSRKLENRSTLDRRYVCYMITHMLIRAKRAVAIARLQFCDDTSALSWFSDIVELNSMIIFVH